MPSLLRRTIQKLKKQTRVEPQQQQQQQQQLLDDEEEQVDTKSESFADFRRIQRLSFIRNTPTSLTPRGVSKRVSKLSIYEMTPEWIHELSKGKSQQNGLFASFPIITKSPESPAKGKHLSRDKFFHMSSASLDGIDGVIDVNDVDSDYSASPPSAREGSLSDSMVLDYPEFNPVILQNCKNLNERLFSLCSIPNDMGSAMLEQLLKTLDGVVDNIRDASSNSTLLHCASRHNNMECMKHLINYGASVNVTDSIEATPLHYACASGAKNAVVVLLTNKTNVNAKDQYQAFPLIVAMRNNQLEIMKLLVMNNADVHLKEKHGNTCLHIAAKLGLYSRVKFLMSECGAAMTRLNSNNEHVLFTSLPNYCITQYLCENIDFAGLCKLVSVTNYFGKTVIHEACELGHLESLLIIIQSLTQKCLLESNLETLESFLEQKLNEYDFHRGYTPLHLAVIGGHVRTAKFLALASQVDVDKKDLKQGNTALHLAIQQEREEITEVLLSLGKASTEVKNVSKESCRALSKKKRVDAIEDSEQMKARRRFSLQGFRHSTRILFSSQ